MKKQITLFFCLIGVMANLCARDFLELKSCNTDRDCRDAEGQGIEVCDMFPDNSGRGVCVVQKDLHLRNIGQVCRATPDCPSFLVCDSNGLGRFISGKCVVARLGTEVAKPAISAPIQEPVPPSVSASQPAPESSAEQKSASETPKG